MSGTYGLISLLLNLAGIANAVDVLRLTWFNGLSSAWGRSLERRSVITYGKARQDPNGFLLPESDLERFHDEDDLLDVDDDCDEAEDEEERQQDVPGCRQR